MKSSKLTIALLILFALEIPIILGYLPLNRLVHSIFYRGRIVSIGANPIHLDRSFKIKKELIGGENKELHFIAATHGNMHIIIGSVPVVDSLNYLDYMNMVFLKPYMENINESSNFDFMYAGDRAYSYRIIKDSQLSEFDLPILKINYGDSAAVTEDNIFIPDRQIYYSITGVNTSEDDAIETVKQTLYPNTTSSLIEIN